MMLESKIFYEKYAPKTLDQCFLPAATRKVLKKFIKLKDIPNLILSGPSGIGKTTAAKVLVESIGAEWFLINASLKGDINTLRNEITQFASTVSFNGQKKYIILDEADYITNATQGGLRGFIDEFSSNCGFIFTCNFREKIIDAIADSRLVDLSFTLSKEELPAIARQLYDRLNEVLIAEGVEPNPAEVQQLIIESVKQNTDFRKIFNTLQKGCDDGKFSLNRGNAAIDDRLFKLVDLVKTKDFNTIRNWVATNSDIEPPTIMRYLYTQHDRLTKPSNVWVLVCVINKHLYQHSMSIDPEINLMSCLAEIISECLG